MKAPKLWVKKSPALLTSSQSQRSTSKVGQIHDISSASDSYGGTDLIGVIHITKGILDLSKSFSSPSLIQFKILSASQICSMRSSSRYRLNWVSEERIDRTLSNFDVKAHDTKTHRRTGTWPVFERLVGRSQEKTQYIFHPNGVSSVLSWSSAYGYQMIWNLCGRIFWPCFGKSHIRTIRVISELIDPNLIRPYCI